MNAKLIFTAGILVSLQSCGHSGTQPAQQEIRPVKVYATQPLGSVDKDFAGMSVADDISNLAFRISGQILKMNVITGQSVKKGDVIAEINPREYSLQMEADKATYLTARSQMERNKRLLEKQAISRQDYEMADAAYVRAKSAYENSQTTLADTRLRAPFAGAVEKKYVDNYQQVMAGEPVVRLVNPITESVMFTMPESGLQTLKIPGIRFSVKFDNYPGVTFGARLKEYVQTSTQATGISVTLTLEGENLKKYDIAPGMSCMINLRVNNPRPPRPDGRTADRRIRTQRQQLRLDDRPRTPHPAEPGRTRRADRQRHDRRRERIAARRHGRHGGHLPDQSERNGKNHQITGP